MADAPQQDEYQPDIDAIITRMANRIGVAEGNASFLEVRCEHFEKLAQERGVEVEKLTFKLSSARELLVRNSIDPDTGKPIQDMPVPAPEPEKKETA